MSNFALGRLARMTLLFVIGVFITLNLLASQNPQMKRGDAQVVSFFAGLILAAIGKGHT
jgi:hypothetical protein